jgi:shikimate kinase / 3-dehydroquinate synthase
MIIFLYGPPGSGKTTLGRALAPALEMPFYDLDEEIESRAGRNIPEIFAQEGETGFRQRELVLLREMSSRASAVIALGGGALLNPQAREAAETRGTVVFLEAGLETLLARLQEESARNSLFRNRPLLAGDPSARLKALLAERAGHYQSFALRLDTTGQSPQALAWQAQVRLGAFRVHGMGQPYDVLAEQGGLGRLGRYLRERGLNGPLALVSDRNVGLLYQEQVAEALRAEGYAVRIFCFPPGEQYKTIETMLSLWDFFIQSGVERGSTVIALGGGVTGDMAGFAAATFLRGVAWVNLPTSLLAMVDSSLGGKTGIDLPQAKNLVGAFHSPRLVLADPQVLYTLPERELRSGLAETLKHGVIGDPDLFQQCEAGWEAVTCRLDRLVRQAMAVKVSVIEADPFEKGLRQALNLGHTIGHGVELASDFRLSHGEAVAIGCVAEARLAEKIGLAEEANLSARIAAALAGLGLPVEIPDDLSRERIIQAMQLDKKRAAGQIRFALPVRIGLVKTGVVVENWQNML